MNEADFPVAEIRGWGHLSYLGQDKAASIQESNAHLIAAAPELLEALEQHYNECCSTLGFYYDSPLANKTRGLIAKARGEA